MQLCESGSSFLEMMTVLLALDFFAVCRCEPTGVACDRRTVSTRVVDTVGSCGSDIGFGDMTPKHVLMKPTGCLKKFLTRFE